METLALMIVAVGLSLLIGIPLGIAVGRSRRVERVVRPVLDAAQIVPAFAYLMPVVILFSVGPAAAVVATMVYAIPPAVRITALGIRGVAVNTVEAATSMGSTTRQILDEGAVPARAPDDPARRQPDDPLRALDGRDRGADRRRRPRRRRQQRPLHDPVARDPRRVRDRRDGDRARPVDRGDRRQDRSGEAPPRRGVTAAAAAPDARGRARDRRRGGRVEARRRQRQLPGDRAARQDGHPAGVAPGAHPERARLHPGPHVVGLLDHRADGDLHPPEAAAAAAAVPRRGTRGSRRSSGSR